MSAISVTRPCRVAASAASSAISVPPFIRHARELGFEIDQIRTLFDLQDRPDQSCACAGAGADADADADAIAKARLVEVKGNIASLIALQHDWLKFMEMAPAGPLAEVDRYIGHWEPYATNHQALDRDLAMQGEVRNAAQTLAEALLHNNGGAHIAGNGLHPPRQK